MWRSDPHLLKVHCVAQYRGDPPPPKNYADNNQGGKQNQWMFPPNEPHPCECI